MANRSEYFRKLAIESIEEASKQHKLEECLSIGDNMDNFESLLDEEELKQGSSLHIALEFLSGWSDSAAHDWYHYEPLKKDDWPRMANIILSDLKANREISDPQIVSEFRYIPKPKISIITRIKSLFKNEKT